MKQTWRWFGPDDEITIPEIRQTGATGVVSALHHIPSGAPWSKEEIKIRQREVEFVGHEETGLKWDVVESVPVSENIKSQSGDYKQHFESYRQSIINLAECGIHTVCYNFMPVLDWTRTDLASILPNGGKAMRFDLVDFIAFDRFILKRLSAQNDYSAEILEVAQTRFASFSKHNIVSLTNNIVAGLPGANDKWSLSDVRDHLAIYSAISADTLRQHLIDFLSEVIPTAEKYGVRLCCHPDDPPFPLLGLPRIMSSEKDYATILNAVDSPSCGATLCTGSLGVAKDFDPVSFVENLGSKIHFVHLRNTYRQSPCDGSRYSFYESEHLSGDTNMVATIEALIKEEKRRKDTGRTDWEIPMRPDHGHALLGDLDRPMMPGYPLIGRMRGLAELRGVITALNTMFN